MSGFQQIELEETSRNITPFSTSNDSYRFTRLPDGLKIAPRSFQIMMAIAFSGIEPSQALLYTDDLIVIGCSEKHMITHLTNVFDLCRRHNLKLHPEKCTFFRHEVTFIGHKCTDKGILPDCKKYDVIEKYPVPTDADSARRFVAFTKGKSNKNTYEQELAAIHWAINYFRPYIYGRHFTVKTDIDH